MSETILRFEERCKSAGVPPRKALKAVNLDGSLWTKWRSGKVSPTLKSFELAQKGLELVVSERNARQST